MYYEEETMAIKTRAALLKGPYDIDLIEKELVCDEDGVIVRITRWGSAVPIRSSIGQAAAEDGRIPL